MPRGHPRRARARAIARFARLRLDYALGRLVVNGAEVEYHANTIAVIRPMHPIVRLAKFVLTLPIIPIRIALRVIAWAFSPRG